MERNEIETVRARQLISEHFDFALSQLNSHCTKSGEADGEADNLEPELTSVSSVRCIMQVHACM